MRKRSCCVAFFLEEALHLHMVSHEPAIYASVVSDITKS